jgi:hypothetical protein
MGSVERGGMGGLGMGECPGDRHRQIVFIGVRHNPVVVKHLQLLIVIPILNSQTG